MFLPMGWSLASRHVNMVMSVAALAASRMCACTRASYWAGARRVVRIASLAKGESMTEQQYLKPAYAIDSSVARSWELKANNIRLEELLAAYAQVHAMLPQELEWFTATNVKI